MSVILAMSTSALTTRATAYEISLGCMGGNDDGQGQAIDGTRARASGTSL